jgi:hypothetical protein
MSRGNLRHVSEGRKPWQRWVQLRPSVPQKLDDPSPVFALRVAAENAEAPAWFSGWQQAEAKFRLIRLCDWLDDQLARPARVERAGDQGWHIKIFGSLLYSIYPDERYVMAGTIDQRRYIPSKEVFEIGRPVETSGWLKPILRSLGLVDAVQSDVFFLHDQVHDLAWWLEETAFRLLLRHPDFQEFRRRTLPKLFQFPQEIYGIAMASRCNPVGPLLDSRTLNHVWENEHAFRQTARENPQLLPLLLAFVMQIPAGTQHRAKDPVLALKTALRNKGLPEAAWRYVVKHGARLFRVPWEVGAQAQSRFEIAVRYLTALESAGFPPPPPPSVACAFLHGYNVHRIDGAVIANGFENKFDPAVLRAGLLEADRRRADGNVEGFAEEFLGVCWWAERHVGLIDDNQAKAGWKWFVRQWQETESVDALLREDAGLRWQTRLDAFEMDSCRVVPINSSAALIRESQAMRNCLQNCIDNCANGDYEIYSIRDAVSGKRRGCVGFRFDSGMPECFDAKGFANSPPRGAVIQAVNELFARLQRQCGV